MNNHIHNSANSASNDSKNSNKAVDTSSSAANNATTTSAADQCHADRPSSNHDLILGGLIDPALSLPALPAPPYDDGVNDCCIPF